MTGASSGFGEMMSHQLADAGHIVYASMRGVEKHNFRLDEIVEAHRCMEENRAGGEIVVLT